ncbi:unnamed protein product [Tetraodon nigroviridis]|uniref:(spotted green pufferfish) hypothetical protein n=1 Tax=Tetraodon nigroviridis TaxID=99883 RepID=Q4SED1_TETNG|nr:unnamed protein product [Tetraodon nigroviridis]
MASKERLYEVWMLYCTKVRRKTHLFVHHIFHLQPCETSKTVLCNIMIIKSGKKKRIYSLGRHKTYN